jgi:hypothetical protein
MPFAVHLDESTRVLYVQASGDVNDAELEDLNRRVRQDPAFVAGCPVLYNFSGATTVSVSWEAVYALATSARALRNPVAMIAPNPAVFGLVRMYQILGNVERDRIQVFTNEEDAGDWLRTIISSRIEDRGGQ